MKIIKLKLVDFWGDVEKTKESFYNFPMIKMLQKRYNVIYSDKPDFIIYSAFGHEHLKYDCVRIFYSVENERTDWNIADYGITNDYSQLEDRSCHVDYKYWIETQFNDNTFSKNRENNKGRDKFCSIMISDIGNLWNPREHFFHKLSEYKKVDSGGRWNNNIGGPIGNRFGADIRTSKIEWLKQYKFNICFENASYPGYLTEKIFDAFEAGCIPIYWGDTSLRCDLNLKSGKYNEIDNRIPIINKDLLYVKINHNAFINAHNYSTWNELIEEIKRIDNDKDLYLEMLSQPIFLNNFKFDAHNEMVDNFLYHIFDQDVKDAFRRGIYPRSEKILYIKKTGISAIQKNAIMHKLLYKINLKLKQIKNSIKKRLKLTQA